MPAPTYPLSDDLAEGTGTRSHAAKTTAAGDWLVVEIEIEAGTTNVFTPSCATLTFTKQNDTGTGAGDAQCVQWTAPDAAGASRTVTITPGGSSTLNYRSHLTIVRGSNGPGTGKAVSANGQTVSVVRQGNNSGMFMAVADFSTGAPGASQTWTPGGTTLAVQQGVGATYFFGRWDDSGTAATASHGLTSPAGLAGPSIAVLEMLGTAASSIPPPSRRDLQTRDAGEAWWIQKDLRNANLVATAANPLPSPLDSAWQAGARFWHLYGDTADASPRTWQSLQRNLISDPNMLGAVDADPLLVGPGVGGDEWRRYNTPAFVDHREVPQQRPYVSDPALLNSALLENELLGSGDDVRRRYTEPAGFVDRREVPQQRVYVSDPLLLGTALLENELLGGADTGKRYLLPATNVDRRQVPQQRRYVSDPLLLTSALLENELLGSADDLRRRYLEPAYYDRREVPQQRPYVSDPLLLTSALLENELLGGADTPRHYLAATFYDRREVPQQRQYVSDPALLTPPVPLDPTLAAWAAIWQMYNQAALHADRREVPQQRAYISDPSFYPTIAPTDPLTLAFGAGGTYWLLYNEPALNVDRREVPQQRRYISDPGLLSSALLENELLGSADDLRRRYLQPAEFVDRREVPQQRLYVSDPAFYGALLENELLGGADDRSRHASVFTDRRQTVGYQPRWPDPALLGPAPPDPLTFAAGVGGDLWRRYNLPDYANRRQTAVQPLRSTVYFDAGPGQPPLTLAWGAGGNLWHIYNRPSRNRPAWPQQFVVGIICACLTTRPNTGVTTRGASGTTVRPNTGVTPDPCC